MTSTLDLLQISKRRVSLVNGYPLIDNRFMQLNENIMANAFSNNQRTGTTIFLHPGTNQLFYQAILYALMAGYLTYNFQIEEYATQFIEGDTVILDGSTRCKFMGIDRDLKYFTVLEDDRTWRSNPLSSIHRIKLYEGDAKTLGAKGIRKKVREAEKFLEEWVGSEYAFVARTKPFSILVVCNKEEAQEIANNIIFSYKEQQFLFSELFPSTWFSTMDSENDFFGNSVHTSPVVIFTSRISIAREIIFKDRDEKIRSVIINGIDIISSSPQELEDIMQRRSVHSAILLAGTSYGVLPEFQMNDDTQLSLVYWSKQALLSMLDDLNNRPSIKNPQEILLKKLIDHEIDRETVFNQVFPPFDSDLPNKCRKALKQICNFSNDDFNIKKFMISAYGLLKLYEQSCFPISYYEELIKSGSISARLPSDELIILNEIYDSQAIETELKDAIVLVISALTDMHYALYERNPKYDKLLSLLFDGTKKMTINYAIVVPKESYVSTVNKYIESKLNQSVNVYSSGKFNNDAIFDKIIVGGIFDGKKFDPFKSNSAPLTIILGYPSEEGRFYWLKNQSIKIFDEYEARSILSYEKDTSINEVTLSIQEEMESVIELENRITEMTPDVLTLSAGGSGNQATIMLNAVRLIIFENGEWGLFTEHYSPYVFDEKDGKITDGEVGKLSEGDLLIFAVKNDITDFVDTIMDKLIPSTEQRFQEFYRMSRRWKTILQGYMRKNNMSYVDIARELEDLGHPKHQVTIRSWLNEDSRIIGPRDEDSYIAIALITDDNEMEKLSSTYCKACNEVRSMRIRILHYIENQIVKSFAGVKAKQQDQLMASVIGDAKQYARGLRIESIKSVDQEIPASIANRPHKL
jgi:hypothetical protein